MSGLVLCLANEIENLYQIYPWLKINHSVEEYIEPRYYNRLLKDYIFEGKSDINIFKNFLNGIDKNKHIKALELGCGSGRATEVFINYSKNKNFDLKLVDLSKNMLDFSKRRFQDSGNIQFIKSDSIDFIKRTTQVYDLIFSLWSFSHSVHQNLIKKGMPEGKVYVKNVLKKMVKTNMADSSKFFLIHFDSLSEEQKILMRQWRKAFPIYKEIRLQSPSKRLIDEAFKELKNEGIIKLKTKHIVGKAIHYTSFSEALEIFFNFHMESYFNKSPLLPEMINELKEYFTKFANSKNEIKIKPGCFVYEVEKYG